MLGMSLVLAFVIASSLFGSMFDVDFYARRFHLKDDDLSPTENSQISELKGGVVSRPLQYHPTRASTLGNPTTSIATPDSVSIPSTICRNRASLMPW